MYCFFQAYNRHCLAYKVFRAFKVSEALEAQTWLQGNNFFSFHCFVKKKVFEPQLVSQIHRLITTQPFKPNLRGFKASSQFKANILSLRCEKISERGKNPPRRLSILAREMYQQMRMRKYIWPPKGIFINSQYCQRRERGECVEDFINWHFKF